MNPWRTACPDWETRIAEGRSLIPSLPIYDEPAERALRVFKRLRVPDLAGRPTHGEVCADWVFDLVRVIFGSYDPETKRRMIREFFLLIPKKNGKSSIAAAIMVTAAIVNERPEAELLLIAPTKKVADTAFKQASSIIRCDAELLKIFHLQQHQRTITHRISGAQILIKAADADVITGSKATYILVDETHVFALKARAAEVFVEIRGSLASRPDGFMLQITTQSKEPPAGVFKSELAIARDVRDGLVDLPLLPILYELPEAMARDGGWKDPKTWPLVNPNYGLSVDPDFLRDELIKAEREGIEKLQLLASQHFNVEVALALRHDHLAGALHWEDSTDETITFETILERCDVAVIGGDGGGLDDLFGATVLGRCRTTRDWLSWSYAWVQPHVLEMRPEIASNLLDFKADAHLTICETPTQDIEEFVQFAVRLKAAGLLPAEAAIGLDPQGVTALIDALVSAGISDKQLVAVLQGFRLSGAIWGTERKLADGTLWHADQRMMSWVVGNMKAEQRGNAVLITKQVAGRAKIDPGIALFNAVQLMSRNPAAAAQAVYEKRGIVFV